MYKLIFTIIMYNNREKLLRELLIIILKALSYKFRIQIGIEMK